MTIPNVINDFGVNELLRRRYNVVESGPAPSLAPEISPIISAAPYTPEQDLYSGWYLAAGLSIAPALAGSWGRTRLANPPGSAVIAVVESLILHGNGVDLRVYRTLGDPLSNADVGSLRDFRNRAAARETALTLTNEASGSFPIFSTIFYVPGSPQRYHLQVPIVLAPGTGLGVIADQQSAAFAVTYVWRERRAQPAEL